MKKIVVGISGGVDSSVAAYLLKEQGYDVTGVFMKNWEEAQGGQCTAQQDYEDARAVCLKLGIPFYAVDFSKEYYSSVFEDFLSEYKQGRTPNPDVFCNSKIKFKVFRDYVKKNFEAEAIATGHYAKLLFDDKGFPELYRALDLNKDQTYFLSFLSREQLSDAMFPLGDITKPEVRKIAAKLSLRTAKKKDSTGICFIGERNFREFLKTYLKETRGKIVDADTGKTVGEHIGLMYYTIGQRRGLNIGGCGSGERWFVVDKDMDLNILYVVQGADNPKNFALGFTSNNINLISPTELNGLNCTVKYRYRQADVPCRIVRDDKGTVSVLLNEPGKGIAPGQIGVFYLNDKCLGGAVIENVIKN